MPNLERVAPAFQAMAHEIVWASVVTVDRRDRPRGRVLHPFWEWDGASLVGWVATAPTPLKRAHLARNEHVSINYWAPSQDTCVAECGARWHFDAETRERVWNRYLELPEPLGYDPKIIPGWTGPDVDAFAVLRFDPWYLRVFPGTALLGQGGDVLVWQAD
ncbi:MAG: pyridoxamine 5'-phosphate oxidase family protein [Myxococcota bacterium]